MLLRRRPDKGLLGGMMEFPSTPWREERWSEAQAKSQAPMPMRWQSLPGVVRHGFTHFELELRLLHGKARADREGRWCAIDRLSELALPSLMKKVAKHALGEIARPSRKKVHHRGTETQRQRVNAIPLRRRGSL